MITILFFLHFLSTDFFGSTEFFLSTDYHRLTQIFKYQRYFLIITDYYHKSIINLIINQ